MRDLLVLLRMVLSEAVSERRLDDLMPERYSSITAEVLSMRVMRA